MRICFLLLSQNTYLSYEENIRRYILSPCVINHGIWFLSTARIDVEHCLERIGGIRSANFKCSFAVVAMRTITHTGYVPTLYFNVSKRN